MSEKPTPPNPVSEDASLAQNASDETSVPAGSNSAADHNPGPTSTRPTNGLKEPTSAQPVGESTTLSGQPDQRTIPVIPISSNPPHARLESAKLSFREYLDTFVFVVFLVLLLKTFIAEAFVIPTGSMAPTRLGHHLVNICPQCGHEYFVGYSPDSVRRRVEPPEYVVCPNCRHAHFPGWVEGGDKVLVLKTVYDFSRPNPAEHRHDIVVFKFPGWGERAIGDQEFEGPTAPHHNQAFSPYNYIKRLWGFPGERLAIWLGDVYLATDEDKPKLTILRKRPDRMLDMRQLVYDADHEPQALADAISRWEDDSVRPVPGSNRAPEARSAESWQRQLMPAKLGLKAEFYIQAGDRPRCLRYEHRVPKDWTLTAEKDVAETNRSRRRILAEASAAQIRSEPPLPQLITDFTAYNWTNRGSSSWHWVRDLMIDCELEVLRPEGMVALELISGTDCYRAEFDLSTGQCQLRAWREGLPLELIGNTTAPTKISRRGRYHLQFCDFDQRLTLWVNGKLIFGEGVEIPPLRPDQQGPRLADLAPAGIWAQRTEVRVRHLQLWRDIYYTRRDPDDVRLILFAGGREPLEPNDIISLKNVSLTKYSQWAETIFRKLAEEKPHEYRDALPAEQAALHRIRPERWAPYYPRGVITHQISPNGTVAFGAEGSYEDPAFYPERPHGGPRVFGPDEYFVLGDNSTSSQDSRAWGQVPERLLMGKAVVVYFPFRPFGSSRVGLIR
ncbi:MAG: S26 family signal peptidase [Gemmatales bacterium]|nr:S26 family signal peptidase [Gemmatales bacterium]MDW7995122.1 S26 family signal peptidase [Gemmatales bacterium]